MRLFQPKPQKEASEVATVADVMREMNMLLANVNSLLEKGVLSKPQAFQALKQFGLVAPEEAYTALPEPKKNGVGFTAEVV